MKPPVEKKKTPLYRKGQLVEVVDYYQDEIVRGKYQALVLGIREHCYKSHSEGRESCYFMYDLLPLGDSPYNQYRYIAEEYQMCSVGKG